MAVYFPCPVFASLGGEGFVPDFPSFVRNQPAPIVPGAGFSLRGFCAVFRVICAGFRVSFRVFPLGRVRANPA